MSLVSFTAQGRAGDEELPSPQLLCNSCRTRLEEEFKELGWGGMCPVGRARPLGQAVFGPGTWGQEKESRLELQASGRQAVGP